MPKIMSAESIDVAKLIRRQAQKEMYNAKHSAYSAEKPKSNLKSFFFDPLSTEANYYGGIKTISPHYGRIVNYELLRRVAEKCWIINLCISSSIKQARPYFKESTGENQRGFMIKNKKAIQAGREMSKKEKEEAERLAIFLLNTGSIKDPNRTDDLDKYATKIIRDLYQLDQIATELQRAKNGELCAFWAIDVATIEVALPGSARETGIHYAQVINNVPRAYYSKDDLIFDCMNPRTDIRRAGYGYSLVEQAIDLVTSSINTFMFNAGFFTENKLPRGILLLQGDPDKEEVDDIQDHIVNIMSGPPTSQWRIPVIPSGSAKSTGGKYLEWLSLQGSNKDMEFQAWYDLQLSAIVALFGKSMEELGLHSQKSQTLFAANTEPKMEASKSLCLGDLLSFLQKHFNHILTQKNPDYCLEFVGYEKDNPKLVADIDKSEIETWKTLNEKRVEKGMDAIDLSKVENPADIPMNVQAVQLWQSQQQGGGGSPFGGEGFEEGEEEGGEYDEGSEVEEDEVEKGGDTEGEETGGQQAEDVKETSADESGGKVNAKAWDELNKSLGKKVKV